MKTINVGITSIGSGVGQSVIDSCCLSGLPLRTFGYGANPFAYGAFSCDFQRPLSGIYSASYVDQVLDVCQMDRIDVLIPGLDDELLLFADNLARFRSIGVVVPVSSRELIELCRDKERMSSELNPYGGCFVRSYTKAQLQFLIERGDVAFPLIAKPVSGFASRGLSIVRNERDLARVSDSDVIQEIAAPSINDPNRTLFMDALQKGVVAQVGELSLQILVGKNGKELGRYASYNKLHNGVPIEIVPADVPEMWAAVDHFLPVLMKHGIHGPLNIQGRMTDAGPKFFEMNARFTGITGLRAMTGFNEVGAIIADAVGNLPRTEPLRQNPRKIGVRQVANKVVDLCHHDALTKACCFSGVVRTNGNLRKVMVTGANSYLGRAVLDALQRNEQVDEVFALVRSPERFGVTEPKLPVGVTIVALEDLYNGSFMPGLVDVICHVASARPINSNREIAESLQFTQFITTLASSHQIPGFINISSQSVYGTHQKPLWRESTPIEPETPYAQSKWAGELMAENITRMNPHCAHTSLRIGKLIGPSCVMRFDELAHKYMRAALSGEALSVWGGEQTLDLIDVRDAAEVIADICARPYKSWIPLLNLSGGSPVSVMKLAETSIEIARQRGGLSGSIERRDFLAPSFGMAIDQIQSSLGWHPKRDIRQSLQDVAAIIQHEIQK